MCSLMAARIVAVLLLFQSGRWSQAFILIHPVQLVPDYHDNWNCCNCRKQAVAKIMILEDWIRDYLYLMNMVLATYSCEENCAVKLSLISSMQHRLRLKGLLEEARRTEPNLPPWPKIGTNQFNIDEYGFKHFFHTEEDVYLYVVRQLHNHYIRFQSQAIRHKARWDAFKMLNKQVHFRVSPQKGIVVEAFCCPSCLKISSSSSVFLFCRNSLLLKYQSGPNIEDDQADTTLSSLQVGD
ncbi:unnamed protein product [Protopolystoma xenopodis]|uniref:Programmed cell death protein 2 C-terminal domain-containing protein n=1 Tax=Protopolystoma xenopodis TaxID=117903 RepID=A0A3S5CHF1_9PLAT|nr:unnamed protein product [Protopolystoma xenopodis]